MGAYDCLLLGVRLLVLVVVCSGYVALADLIVLVARLFGWCLFCWCLFVGLCAFAVSMRICLVYGFCW